MKHSLLVPVFSCLLLLSCTDRSDSESDEIDESTASADTISDPLDSAGSGDPTHDTDMETWATTYATNLGTPDHPGFLDVWSAYGGDIDRDGDTDSIGLFSMSIGGTYAAVFLQNDTGLEFDAVLRIGWRSEIIDSLESIGDGRIEGRTLVWRENDGHCCPTDSGRIALTWKPGELVAEE